MGDYLVRRIERRSRSGKGFAISEEQKRDLIVRAID